MESLRVYYVERQRLVAADLQSEQEYLIGLDERHYLRQHGPGIVRGLHITVDGAGRYWVEPGIAIDSSGRELLLTEREPITIGDAEKCADVWLIYCRQPLRLRQLGRSPCSPNTFQRLTEIPRVLVVSVEKIINPEPPPAEKNSDPEPPVDGAVFLGRINCEEPQQTAYTALHGREVADPGGRTLMQTGPRAALDADSFVLSVADATGNLTRRIVIDRRENNFLSGTLELLGYYESLIIPVPDKAILLMTEPAKLGESVQIELEVIESPFKVKLKLESRHDPNQPAPEQFAFDPENPKRDEELETFNKTSNLARISVLTEFPSLKGQTIRPQSLSAGQQLALTGWGGTLELDDWPEQDEAENSVDNKEEKKYGCYDSPTGSVAEDVAEPTGLSFLPVSQPLKGAPLPRIYSAVATAGERIVEQLRLDLGEKKDIDFTERLTIGAWPGDPKKFTALTINGKCRFSLTSENETVPDTLISMMVTGSIEQTIKPDPTDPLFADLLVAAWMYGLRSSALATTNITVTIEDLPSPLLIETKKPWNYKVRLVNGEDNKVVADKLLEILKIAGLTLPNSHGTNIEIKGKETVDIPVNHSAGEIPAGELDIEIMVSGNVGKVAWVKSATKLKIPVVETPQADVSDVPDFVPPSSEWSHMLKVKNLATRSMTLLEVRRTEGAVDEQLLAAPVVLPAQQNKEFGPFTHPGGLTQQLKQLDVSLFVRYQWENGPTKTITSEPKSITTETQLRIDFQTPDEIEVSTPWVFSLDFENSSRKPIRPTSLEQRLRSADFPNTPFQAIPGLPTTQISPGDFFNLENIPGIEVPSATTQVTLEIRAEYEHDGRTWHPPSFETNIPVVPKKP